MARAFTRVTVHPLPKDAIEPPHKALLQYYLSLLGGAALSPLDLDTSALEALAPSPGAARQVAHQWTKHHLAVRLRFGSYAMVDPSVAIRAWGIPSYYAELLVLHDVLAARKIPHAFACLTAATHADYVPERPLLVTHHDEERQTDRLEAIRYDFPRATLEEAKLAVLGEEFAVPILPTAEAAIVFAALGTPRETMAARELAQQAPLDERVARRLNHFGVRLDARVFRSEDPRVKLPKHLEARRSRLAESLLAEGSG